MTVYEMKNPQPYKACRIKNRDEGVGKKGVKKKGQSKEKKRQQRLS